MVKFLKYFYISCVYLFLYVPLLVTIVFSFNDSAFAETPTLLRVRFKKYFPWR